MKNNRIIKWIIAFATAVVLLLGIYRFFGPKPQDGIKHITIEVVDSKGETDSYELSTDSEYLIDAMNEISLVTDFSYEGEESSYGLYLTTVNGESADFNTDGAYWAIYVNDAYGENGVESQPLNDGDKYTFTYTKAE